MSDVNGVLKLWNRSTRAWRKLGHVTFHPDAFRHGSIILRFPCIRVGDAVERLGLLIVECTVERFHVCWRGRSQTFEGQFRALSLSPSVEHADRLDATVEIDFKAAAHGATTRLSA